MNLNLFRTLVVLSFVCFCVGCGSSYPPVSGKVTYAGEPISGIRLVFSPAETDNTREPGPFSVGVTDEEGFYTLETRDGKPGAVVGVHNVGVDWADIRSYTMRDLERALSESRDDPELVAKYEAKIADVKQKLASRPKLRPNLQVKYTIPEGGTDSADFEIAGEE